MYKHCKRTQENNHLLLRIEKYMIDSKLFNSLCNENNNIKVVKKKQEIKNVIQPKYFDTLFWCFFIIKYGYIEYLQIEEHNFKKEKDIKILNIEKIKQNSSILKNYKLSKSKIECDLLNSKYINMYSFFALCLYNNVNCILIKNNCYYEFICNINDNISLVYLDKKASCELNVSKKKVDEVKKKYLKIENINKPIKAISSYKISELVNFSKYFNIKTTYDSGKNKIKKDLYDEIKSFIEKN